MQMDGLTYDVLMCVRSMHTMHTRRDLNAHIDLARDCIYACSTAPPYAPTHSLRACMFIPCSTHQTQQPISAVKCISLSLEDLLPMHTRNRARTYAHAHAHIYTHTHTHHTHTHTHASMQLVSHVVASCVLLFAAATMLGPFQTGTLTCVYAAHTHACTFTRA